MEIPESLDFPSYDLSEEFGENMDTWQRITSNPELVGKFRRAVARGLRSARDRRPLSEKELLDAFDTMAVFWGHFINEFPDATMEVSKTVDALVLILEGAGSETFVRHLIEMTCPPEQFRDVVRSPKMVRGYYARRGRRIARVFLNFCVKHFKELGGRPLGEEY